VENPFQYGSIVTGDDFVDREKELELLVREIRSGQRVLLYSNRRMGKSSLLKELARLNRKEFIFAYVDLYGVPGKNKFFEMLIAEVARAAFTNSEKLVSAVTGLIKETRIRFVITGTGRPGVELDQAELKDSDLADVIDLPEKIAKKRGKRVVVVLDEFQELLSIGGVQTLKRMRSRIQHHKHATYIFSGSKRHLLRQMFQEEEGAFYKSARPFELGPISRSAFEKLIVDKFEESGGSIEPRLAKRIVDVSQGYPYYVQQIAHELFDITNKPRKAEEVEEAIRIAVEHHVPAFLVVWDSVRSQLQRRYLIAVAKEPGVGHGTKFIEKYGLKSYSHKQRIEKQLQARGLIESGDLVDPMLALWLRNLSGSA
jgi:AAA+ ATPase superfamily predicted ATPase